MDKQIIIDGIDVSGCEWFYKNDPCKNTCKYFCTPCEWVAIQNCMYKYAKRKEQECEELKKQLKEMNEVIRTEATRCNLVNILKIELDQLKAENDNLKSLIWWIHVGAEGADKATTEYYENRNTPYEENYWKRIRALQPPTYESKYKLALTEIKEIAEHCIKQDICTTCDNSEKCHIENEEIPTYDVCKLILQKISECEV
jgi:hypothetical protein